MGNESDHAEEPISTLPRLRGPSNKIFRDKPPKPLRVNISGGK